MAGLHTNPVLEKKDACCEGWIQMLEVSKKSGIPILVQLSSDLDIREKI